MDHEGAQYKTLRDEIAIEVMKVLISMNMHEPAKTAKKSYQFADSMLEASNSTASQTPTTTS